MVVFDDELSGFVRKQICVVVSSTYATHRTAVAPVPTTISTTLTPGLEGASAEALVAHGVAPPHLHNKRVVAKTAICTHAVNAVATENEPAKGRQNAVQPVG